MEYLQSRFSVKTEGREAGAGERERNMHCLAPLKQGRPSLRGKNNSPRGYINTYLDNCKNQIAILLV